MKSRLIIVAALAFALSQLLVIPAYADSILISQTGPGTGAWGIDAVESNAVSWSAVSAYSNVTVSANLIGDFGGTAYLTTSIGPGTTSSDVLMTSAFTLTSPNTHVWTDLFAGINLGPGTFYLVIGSTAINGGGWSNTYSPILTTASGITYNGSYASVGGLNNLGFFPASTFTSAGDVSAAPFQFEVSGNSKTHSVPEPDTYMLLSFGITGLIVVKRRQTPNGL